jgi:hypothetical protein
MRLHGLHPNETVLGVFAGPWRSAGLPTGLRCIPYCKVST